MLSKCSSAIRYKYTLCVRLHVSGKWVLWLRNNSVKTWNSKFILWYAIKVRNSFFFSSTFIFITIFFYCVLDMGIFETTDERRVSVELGQAAILDLPPIDSVPTPSVTWQDEEHALDFNIKYAVTLKNQLIILNVDETDARAYRARAINTILGKEENSAFIQLNVSGDSYGQEIAPEIIVHPENLQLIRGEELARLQCIANARPLHELETLWMKDGILIENTGLQHTLDDPWNRTLALLSANLTHTGQYTCQVRLRSGGFPTVTSTATVIVQEPPSFFSPLRTETLGEYGATLIIPCDVIGIWICALGFFFIKEIIYHDFC